MGNAVILQDDALLHLFEKPADGTDHANSASQVHIGIETLDLARPVDFVLDHCSGLGHLFGFSQVLEVRAIAGHEHTRRRHRTDGVDHLAQSIGSTPDDQEDWG